ncbi:DUF2637 domain-containing protein [Streptomyces sp. NBC_00341]|uniref:DUF2637 domain-containing protein n=1 Tax=Streptomyces sp. NBC_00341 TaxID=2975717 RepID=UPI00308A91BD|nr:DUF2637 domain-containing protein [Streptomyces sp. NBC_00341]
MTQTTYPPAPAMPVTGEDAGMQDPMTNTMEKSPVSAGGPAAATYSAAVSVTKPVTAADATTASAPSPDVTADVAVGETEQRPAGRHRKLMIPLAVVAVLSGLAAATIGFALSYGALRSAAVGWGFGTDWQSYAFPVGVDGLIIALYTIDLVLAWKGMARPWVRMAAHAITAVTIALNMAAAAGSAPGSPGLTDALGEHPARLLAHAGMPIAYVLLTEAARWAIVRTAQLEAGAHTGDRLTVADWVLRLPTTWKIFRHAKTWPSTYAEARTHVRDLAVYKIWLKHREEIEAGLAVDRVGVLDRMPGLLARYGVSVDEARALPALMQERERQLKEDQDRAEADRKDRKERERQEQQRERELQARQDERERQRQAREDEHAERLAVLAAEAEETRLAGELAVLRAETSGAARAAEATADGAGAAAELAAQTTLAAARRVATQEERRTAQEETAEETARTAEAKSRTAAAQAATAANERKAAEEAARIADAKAAQERSKAQEMQEQARAASAAKTAAADQEEAAVIGRRAAAIEREAAELARLAAETRARAAQSEALSDLTPVQIKTRVAARVLLANPAADGAQIAAALGGASPSTASTYRKAAQELIAQGYPDTDPDLTAAPTAAPVTIPGQTEITV